MFVADRRIQVLVVRCWLAASQQLRSVEHPIHRIEHVDQYHEQHSVCMVTALSPRTLDGLS